MPLSRPEPLTEAHDLTAFSSGVSSLDDWLKYRARANQVSGASRTFVTAEGSKVIGYCALALGAIAVGSGVGRFRRNMPDPIPVAVLGRLAIDQRQQGRGLGRALFRDCALRVTHAADTIGIHGIVVLAISEQARAFYLALGFDPSPQRAPDPDGHARPYSGAAAVIKTGHPRLLRNTTTTPENRSVNNR